MRNKNSFLFLCLLSLMLYACSSPGPGLFGKKTPHEQYEKKIKDAGLKETALGDAWLKTAAITLSNPLDISLPYSETGYFADDRANGIGLRFRAKRGQKLKISLTKKPVENFAMYVDLWQSYSASENKTPKFLLAADTINLSLEYVVTEDSAFIVRIQPELLKEGEYTLTITAGPSLAFPVSPKVKSNIGSFFGTGRDNGERKHEGIDIFAPVHSPAVASANGVVTRVNENALGGKVIFLQPDNASYSLYYAHLDSQIAKEGQRVKSGDILGLTEYVVTEDSAFIVRIQPELLKEGEYTLTITAGPSLAFPVSPKVKSNIGSFFGTGRDKGERKHEGIDIFAPVHSPAVASANGVVTRVNENALGGKVIFMQPDNAFYSLYYAHLDSQIAKEGQRVKSGDILGLTGNTGNAKFTASHLHFGIYTNSGAIDPLYFVKADYKE